MKFDIKKMVQSIESYKWFILPGRNVSHATMSDWPICGQCNSYQVKQLLKPSNKTKKCEQCLIYLVSGISGGYENSLSNKDKNLRRKAYRFYRENIKEFLKNGN